MTQRRIGIVLGAGAARGWAHIGVLQAIGAMGMPVHAVCGCSSGALVAASFAAGRLDALADFAGSLTQTAMLRYLDLSFSGSGVIRGQRIADFMRDTIGDVAIQSLPVGFGAVATEYGSGREVWFTRGSLIDATRASLAMPGVLTPVTLRGRIMVDGALVNPLPVSLCRSLGADIVIAVNTGGELTAERPSIVMPPPGGDETDGSSWLNWIASGFRRGEEGEEPEPPRPRYFDVLGDATLTMQSFITRIRMAVDPPDIVISPKVSDIGIMEFFRGEEAIARGRQAVTDMEERLTALRRRAGYPAAAPPADGA